MSVTNWNSIEIPYHEVESSKQTVSFDGSKQNMLKRERVLCKSKGSNLCIVDIHVLFIGTAIHGQKEQSTL